MTSGIGCAKGVCGGGSLVQSTISYRLKNVHWPNIYVLVVTSACRASFGDSIGQNQLELAALQAGANFLPLERRKQPFWRASLIGEVKAVRD